MQKTAAMLPLPDRMGRSGFAEKQMKKSDWYENRIRWRAKKRNLENFQWQVFEASHPERVTEINPHLPGLGSPILVFWKDDEQWTVLTTSSLVGTYQGVLSTVDLDAVGKISTVNDTVIPPNEFKKYAELIRVGANGAVFWTPPGETHYALWNILRMFPLNVPD